MTEHEKFLIRCAVRNAICFGLGLISRAKETIEDHGYQWTENHEAYIQIAYEEVKNER